jgi:hypothetical protein
MTNPFGARLKQSQTAVAKRIKRTFLMITQLLVKTKQVGAPTVPSAVI